MPHSNIIMWWRAGMMAGGIALMAMAFFSFFLYQRVATLASEPELFAGEERPALFSPVLLEDIKTFWEKKIPR